MKKHIYDEKSGLHYKLVGDYYNVMGLPVCRLGQLLRQTVPELMEETL